MSHSIDGPHTDPDTDSEHWQPGEDDRHYTSVYVTDDGAKLVGEHDSDGSDAWILVENNDYIMQV